MKKIAKDKRAGFVLVSALLVTSISIVMLVPYVSGVMGDLKLTSIVNNSVVAVDLAEAGIERAIWEIAYNGRTGNFTVPTSSLNTGEYDAEVTFPAGANSATIKSYGYVPNKAAYESRKIVYVEYAIQRAFSGAVAGLDSITMSGQASTDSYDSSLGAYNAMIGGVRNIGQEGDIASNGEITLGAQTQINGDANPGEDYPFDGTPPVTGSYGTLQAPLVVDAIPDLTAYSADNDNDNITITNDDDETGPYTDGPDVVLTDDEVLTLPGGTYYFTSLRMSGQSTINVTGASGPAIIYIDSAASASGGVVDVQITGQGIINNSVPANLQIYCTGDSVKLAGQASFSGVIYAPSATVTMSGQADIYGSIVCGSNVDSGQAAVHYDINLANVKPDFVVDKVTSWQELWE